MSHLSNQPTICSSRSTRCHGWPERESSWPSFGNRTGRNLSILKRDEHLFAAGARRSAVVGLAKDEHHRRRHLVDVCDRRTRGKVFFLLERGAAEPFRLELPEIRGVPPVGPVRDVTL